MNFWSGILCYHYGRWHWKCESFHTLFVKYFDFMLVKFEQNRIMQNIHFFEFLAKKWLTNFFFGKCWRHFGRRFCEINNCLMLKYKWKLSSFIVPKIKGTIWVSDTNRVCHVWCNFYHGNTSRTAVIFEILIDGSLQINCLAFNNCFSSETSFKMAWKLCKKIVFQKAGFLSKSSKYWPYDFV